MGERLRLLVLTSTFPRWRGDHEPPFVYELARRCDDFEVHVLAPHAKGASTDEVLDDIRVHRFRYAPKRWEKLAYDGGIPHHLATNRWLLLLVPVFVLAQVIAAWRLCYRYRINIIHAHWLIPQGLVGAIVKLLFRHGPRLVVTVHGADLYTLRNRLINRLRTWVAGSAESITVVSRALQKDLVKLVADPEKLVVAPMGVDLTRLFVPGDPGNARERIVYAGRLVPKKGVNILLEAFATIAECHPRLRLAIAGHGPLAPNLKRRAKELGLQDRVDFLGRYQLGQLPAIYRGAKLAAFPFVQADDGDREGLGLVVAEALGCGIPVIVGAIPAAEDLVEHEVSGLLVTPGDADALASAISRLLADPDRGERLAQSGRMRAAARLDWSVVAQTYQTLLRGEQPIGKSDSTA